MSWPLPDRLYVTGTDTDVGKTVCAALLCAAGGYDYWKPIQAGLPSWPGPDRPAETDSEVVARLAGVRVHPEALRLTRPASPHAAARDEGVLIDLSKIQAPPGRLLVEGAGGWMVPLGEAMPLWQADLVRHLGLPVLLVTRTTLGTLNHTLLTLRALAADGVPCVGLLFVGPPHPENERELTAWGGVPHLGRVPRVDELPAAFPRLVAGLREHLGAPP